MDEKQKLCEKIKDSLNSAYNEHFGPAHHVHLLVSDEPKYSLIVITSNGDFAIASPDNQEHRLHHSFDIQSNSLVNLIKRHTSFETKEPFVFSYSDTCKMKMSPEGTLSACKSNSRLRDFLNHAIGNQNGH